MVDKKEFVETFHYLKQYQTTENDIYEATDGAIDLGEIRALAELFHFCVKKIADEDNVIIDAIYELLLENSVGFEDGTVVGTPEEFYTKMWGD